ncbi:MAG TPA: DUF3570 domain-containing protein [Kofleriaceae bacterium]|nr:DUF3570 domain-containing protein [Kofleriaceae bacterium]
MLPLAAGLAITGAAATAHAQSTFATKLQVYADDDHTQVVSPMVDAEVDVDDRTHVDAGYVADVVSSASIDVVTQASAITIHDTRHQANLGGWRLVGGWKLSGGYTFSTENDYRSHSISGGFERDLNDKDSTVSLTYALTMNDVGRAGDRNFSRGLTVHDLSAAWTQVIDRHTVAQLSDTLGLADGFQASPYRFVPVVDGGGMPMFWVPETDPNLRVRNAAVIALNRHVGGDASLQADYRFYVDSWGLVSHTIGTRAFVNLTPHLELRLRNRIYTQTKTRFYQKQYVDVRPSMTMDRELSALWSETFGAKLMYALTDRLEAELKLDLFYYHYFDFIPLTERLGTNAGLGLTLTY